MADLVRLGAPRDAVPLLEGTLPVDVAISAELNNEQAEEERNWGIEPRLILSRDFAKANVTVNLAEEVGLSSHETSFDPSLAMRYDATRVIRFGTELRYFTGEGGGAIIPQMAINLPHDVTLRFAFSWGVGNDQGSNFTRMSAEAGLGDED